MKQLHGNSARFVRELTPEESAFISKRVKSTDRNIRDRARVVDLSSEGYSVPQIMEEQKRARNYVLRWIDRFNNEGISGLETKKRIGRPRVYTETEEQKVITLINTRPVDWGLHFNTWDISKLQRYLNERGDMISWSTIKRILTKNKIRLKNAQKWMTSNDPNYQSKKERKEELKSNRPRKGKVVSFDEKGTVTVKHYGGKSYSKEQPKIEAKQNIKGKFELLCAYDLHEHGVYHKFYERKTHEEVADFLIFLKTSINITDSMLPSTVGQPIPLINWRKN
jgi:transposase